MHSAVQTAVVTIISYKPLSGLNFARYTGQYGSYMPSSPLGSISLWYNTIVAVAGRNGTLFLSLSDHFLDFAML